MKLYEKDSKMKKAFCFDICPFLSQEKCVHVWFEFFPNYLSRKKEPRKHFSASALPRPRKIFPWFLFPTSAKIGKNSNQTWTNFSRDKTGQISKQNTITALTSQKERNIRAFKRGTVYTQEEIELWTMYLHMTRAWKGELDFFGPLSERNLPFRLIAKGRFGWEYCDKFSYIFTWLRWRP